LAGAVSWRPTLVDRALDAVLGSFHQERRK